jgi:hypothetical protein
MKKERGFIEVWPLFVLEAVTLWRLGPFRRLLYRDINLSGDGKRGKCHKLFANERWIPNEAW